MGAWAALLNPTDVQRGRPDVDLIPSQVHQFGNPQAVPVGYQNHRGVPVAVAIPRRGVDEPLDLCLGQVFPRPQVAIPAPFGRDCSF
jgi:hypothetical protein